MQRAVKSSGRVRAAQSRQPLHIEVVYIQDPVFADQDHPEVHAGIPEIRGRNVRRPCKLPAVSEHYKTAGGHCAQCISPLHRKSNVKARALGLVIFFGVVHGAQHRDKVKVCQPRVMVVFQPELADHRKVAAVLE